MRCEEFDLVVDWLCDVRIVSKMWDERGSDNIRL